MPRKTYSFNYEWLNDETEMNADDRALLVEAKKATVNAYAPYSHFHVAAAARLNNGKIVAATNQENASYPVGICAERTLMGTLSSLFPNEPIDTMAVTYVNHNSGIGDKPITPCGLCRQSLLEYEQRLGQPMKLILAGPTGPVMILKSAGALLPFGFGPDDLKT